MHSSITIFNIINVTKNNHIYYFIFKVFNEARRNVPSIIYLPSICVWWTLVTDTVKAILITQLSQLPPNIPILFLTTADTSYESLSPDVI